MELVGLQGGKDADDITKLQEDDSDRKIFTPEEDIAQQLEPSTCMDDKFAMLKEMESELVSLESQKDTNEDCKWRNIETKYRYPKFKKTIRKKSCIVANYPPKPYPADVNTWKQ